MSKNEVLNFARDFAVAAGRNTLLLTSASLFVGTGVALVETGVALANGGSLAGTSASELAALTVVGCVSTAASLAGALKLNR